MLERVLEPEVMDTVEDVYEYDAMDHSAVNRVFVDDFLAAGPPPGEILDLGTGTALIPIELSHRNRDVQILAVDWSPAMLDQAKVNVELYNATQQVRLEWVDSKALPYDDGRFASVMSNSLIHHIAQPQQALAEAVRVTAGGGLLFFRDLLRPPSTEELDRLVELYAADATPRQRQLYADSLRAALTLEEVRELVAALGFAPETVTATSDRHWTFSARKDAA